MQGAKIVNYQGCDLDTTDGAMDQNTGKFTAKKSGVYYFHFQTHVQGGNHAFVDIMKGSTRLARVGNYQLVHSSGTMTTSSVAGLEESEEVHVNLFGTNCNIHSNPNKYTVFKGFFLAPL